MFFFEFGLKYNLIFNQMEGVRGKNVKGNEE
jgi:hypothetical protein